MAIIRCNKCAHLQEQADSEIGLMLACPQCGNPTQVYPTLFFVTRLLEKYFTAQREVIRLTTEAAAGVATAAVPAASAMPPAEVDLSNSDRMTSCEQHQPIADWFRQRQIAVEIAAQAVDTSGFFDEVAALIGRDLLLLDQVLDRIRWAQQKGYASTVIPFDGKSPSDVRRLTSFCQQLYEYSFVAKTIPNKQKNHLLLVVQTAPAIRHFFNGEWLEWFALMTCIERATELGKQFSCARNLGLTFADGAQFEVDVFLLLDSELPILIECKSGEYRQDIEKYVRLRKRLGLSGSNVILCVAGLEDEIAKGLTAMYDLSFVSERGLLQHLERLF
ncbi:MAG TPA: hypothetical protein PK440_19320 [Candidatus Accumulibacter phosphatis]|nr:MAG: hypothetical protein AW07_03212 [Candidatus Accumulibacter sp. SK-11]HCN67175.1 hypothetical protein [Accumulibacter sp.]HRL78270.1 hypothetical protein [Candidatus Accumulibacter phosphatis]HRQ97119.1 hypothetical protein [Candidatus Accumulibacter phosphatis]